ncbi:hypothetical protein WCQ02_03580 [Paraburkholderia tropica]|uniref:hypothetical protein n=1 Tax=Paraburkholderia tropica TaxID=92647 RepID=UPI003018583C
MSTAVRIVCEVELTVDTWDSASSFDSLAKQAVREGRQKLENVRQKGVALDVISIKEVKFVTHSIPWEKTC